MMKKGCHIGRYIGRRIRHYIRRKNSLVLLLAILLVPVLQAQDISVTRFYLNETDLTANTRGTTVLDQNGDKCALIRIQTTQKGFSFDVGSAGVQKVEDHHVGEIWVYVPFGVRHISIRHPQLGSLVNYSFPINIQKARTYIMEITSNKVFVNNYDDTRKQKLQIRVTLPKSSFTLNGMYVPLDENGEAEQVLSFGTYTYKVEAERYYPKEGQVTINDPNNAQLLLVDDLSPLMGQLSVHADPYNAEVLVDGKLISSTTSNTPPHSLQVGEHQVLVRCEGYKPEERVVEITQDKTTDIAVKLSQITRFNFSSQPQGALLSIDGEELQATPCSRIMKTGTYLLQARKAGYKEYRQTHHLSSSQPDVHIVMDKIYNYKYELYAEAAVRTGAFTAIGGSLGGYISQVNVELSAYYGLGKNETIYWNGVGTDYAVYPYECVYYPQTSLGIKLGYGISLGTRFRLCPQLGLGVLALHEGGSYVVGSPYMTSALLGLRFSARFGHIGFSLSPEYAYGLAWSPGYEALKAASPTINTWGQGLYVKLGLMLAI